MPAGAIMEALSEPTTPVWSLPFMPQGWAQTPRAVQAYIRTLRDEVAQLHDRMEALEALWVLLAQHGVDPTHNRSERALRRGVLWRKRSLGTASDPATAGWDASYRT